MKSSHYFLCLFFFLQTISTIAFGQSADLSITKSDGVTVVTAGDGVIRTYTITVTNNGPSLASNVLITDIWPAGFSQNSVIGTPAATIFNSEPDGNFSLFYSSLALGEIVTITATYTVPSTTQAGTQTNTVTVSSITPDPTPGNNTASDVNTVNTSANLSITKSDGVTTVTAGDGIIRTYTVIVSNTGPSQADNVTVTDTWPVGFTQGTLTPSQGTTNAAGGNFTWTVGTLAAGGTATITVTYAVPSTTDAGTYTNTATVTSNETDPTPGNNSAIDANTVIENVVLTIAKDFSNPGNDGGGDTPEEIVTAGSTGNTFFIVVTNTGISTADNVIILDEVPIAMTVTNVTGTLGTQIANPSLNDNLIEWSIPSLGAGQSATITVTYSVGAGINTQMVTNIAGVSCDELSGFILNSDDVQIVENVVLTIDKEFQDASVTAGTGGHTFTIVITNTGISSADNVTFNDVVFPGLNVTSVSENRGGFLSLSANTINAGLETLGAGQSWTITVTYTVPITIPTTTITNTANADSDEVTPVFDTDQVRVINNTICPKGKGYWKNHPEEWPASVNSMMVGAVTYTQAQLLDILTMPVGNGNGADASIILAQQLIAAKLNIAYGVSADPVASVVVESDALLSIYQGFLPYKVKPNSTAGQMMVGLAGILDQFNNGLLTPGCFMPPVTSNSTTSVMNEVPVLIPEGFVLEQNKPNPANSVTTISYQLPVNDKNKDYHVTLKVYDLYGREVKTLVNAMQTAGYRSVNLDVGKLTKGVYFYRLTAGSFAETKKIVVVR